MTTRSIAWDKIAKKYDLDFGEEGDYSHKYVIYPAVDAILQNSPMDNIIDLGCGTGTYTRKLSKVASEVYGVDFSPEMIKIAKKRNGKTKYTVADLERELPFEDNKFKLALSIMVLHSLPNITNTLKETYRILKPNGRLIVVIPHPARIEQFRSIQLEDKEKYLTPQKGIFKWKQFGEVCDIPTAFYVRPLEYYFSSFRKAGFVVNDIIEPKIVEDAKKDLSDIHTLSAWNRLREKPSFIIFDCIKLNI